MGFGRLQHLLGSGFGAENGDEAAVDGGRRLAGQLLVDDRPDQGVEVVALASAVDGEVGRRRHDPLEGWIDPEQVGHRLLGLQ